MKQDKAAKKLTKQLIKLHELTGVSDIRLEILSEGGEVRCVLTADIDLGCDVPTTRMKLKK